MITVESKGSFQNTEAFLNKMAKSDIFSALSHYGQEGVRALANATPTDSGLTASSWSYEILQDATSWSIVWSNSNIAAGRPIAILLQYGHATGTGGYVDGQDYINPALRPVFDQIANEAWKVVTST